MGAVESILPVLVVVLPLMAAILVVLVGRWWRNAAWPIALLATAGSAFCAFLLLNLRATQEQDIVHRLGGWLAPTGIEYRVDRLNALVLVMLSVVAFLAVLWMVKSVRREIREAGHVSYYAIVLLYTAGMLGITITADVFNLYVFLEIASITSYVLVAMGRRRESLFAGYTYLVLGSIGATLLLIGIGHLYQATGSLGMADIAERIPEALANRPSVVHTAFAFIVIGLGIKMALFPLHAWQPGAYTHAPSSASLLLAATATKVAAYALYRVAFTVFGVAYVTGRLPGIVDGALIMDGVLVLAAAALVVGPLLAVRQDNLKRMLAYSSVGQIGLVVLGATLANQNAMTGSLSHFWTHAASKGALFAVAGIVVFRAGSPHIDNLRGLGRRAPWTAVAMTVAALSLVGIPLTGGFVTKYYLAVGALDAGRGVLLPFILLSSLLTAIYMWRCLQRVWFAAPDVVPAVREEAPWTMRIPTLALAAACLVLGILAFLNVDVASAAAEALLAARGGGS